MENNKNPFEEEQPESKPGSTRREFITNVSLASAGLTVTPYLVKP